MYICTPRCRENRSDPQRLEYKSQPPHAPAERCDRKQSRDLCVLPHPSAATLTARWEVTPPTGTAMSSSCLAPQHLSSYSLPHQQSKKPAHACQSRSGSRPIAQGCLRGKRDQTSRKSWLASYSIMQIRKKPGETRLGETLHDQGYIIKLHIQPPHTSWGGKGCVCTRTQAGGTSCFHRHLLGLQATKQRVMLCTAGT